MIIGRDEVLRRLRTGERIYWLGGAVTKFWMVTKDYRSTVRPDTIQKLYKDGLITGWGFPKFYGEIELKEVTQCP